jgi:hypothetical protein
VPDDVGDRLPDGPGEQFPVAAGYLVGGAGHERLHVRGGQRRPGRGDLAGQADAAYSHGGGPHVGQGVAGQRLQVGELPAGPVQVDVEQALRQFGLDGDHGQRVAEDVVQVVGDAGAFVLHGQVGDLLLGGEQPVLPFRGEPDAVGGQRAQHHGQAVAVVPPARHHRGQRLGRRGEQRGERDGRGHRQADHRERGDVDQAGQRVRAGAGDLQPEQGQHGQDAEPGPHQERAGAPARHRLPDGAGGADHEQVRGGEAGHRDQADRAPQQVGLVGQGGDVLAEVEQPDGGEDPPVPGAP